MASPRSTRARRAAAVAASTLSLGACADQTLTAPDASRVAPSDAPAFAAAASTDRPALPKVYLNTAWTEPTGRRIRAASMAALQAAVDTARGGDVVLLTPGATYLGNLKLRAKPEGTAWVTIMTDTVLPAPGTRVTPAQAGSLAKLVASVNEPAVYTLAGAHHYRITGLEITTPGGRTTAGTIVQLGFGDSKQTSVVGMAHHITLDRVYVHGWPSLNLQRCVVLNSASTAVVDSYLSECHHRTSDSQAIVGWNGPGPYKIANNYLEGAGENVMFGGGTILIPNQLPSDIEISRNHFYKPPAWKGVWLTKNLLELKAAQRVRVEGNVFENSWVDGQTGFALLFKSAGVSSNPWVVTSDVYVLWNVFRNVASGLSLNDNTAAGAPAARLRVVHNLFDGVGASNGTANKRAFQIVGSPSDVAIVHNTVVPNVTNGTPYVFDTRAGDVGRDLEVTNNVVFKGSYGSATSGYGEGSVGLDRIYSSWTWGHNVQVGFTGSRYPATNFAPAAVTAVGFADYAGGDYRLAPSSPYAGRASDGTDPGVDFAQLAAYTAGVAPGAEPWRAPR